MSEEIKNNLEPDSPDQQNDLEVSDDTSLETVEDSADSNYAGDSDQDISQEEQPKVEELADAYSHAVADSKEQADQPDTEPSEDIEESEAETDSDTAEDQQSEEISENSNDPQDTDSSDEEKTSDIEEGDTKPQTSDDEQEDNTADDDSSEDEPSDLDGEEEDQEISTCSVVEAILFAADEPVGARKIVEIINAGGVKEVKKHIRDLNKKYKEMGCAFRIEELAGGYQMLTRSAYNPWLSKLIKVRSESKLTAAAMETLAIIAYKQPLMRVEIENVRGVAAGEMIRQLIEKGLVKIVGRAEELGRPLLYGTTQKFLDVFGLASVKDLPQPENKKQ